MGYCNPTIVYARNSARTFTATSKPATQMVQDFIDDIAAEIDGILRTRGYALPIPTTATSSLKLLEHGNALGAAMLVEQAASSGGQDKDDFATKLWENWKDAIIKGTMDLDAAIAPGIGEVRSSSTTQATAMFWVGQYEPSITQADDPLSDPTEGLSGGSA